MTKQPSDHAQEWGEEMTVYKPDSLNCPECGHFPLVYEQYDGGDPPINQPYGYYECLKCRYRTDDQ